VADYPAIPSAERVRLGQTPTLRSVAVCAPRLIVIST
jgi:hypothetical protein